MGVTQGAVAQHVRGLEAQLGVRLFERKAKGLAFTAQGRSYHGQVASAFAQLQTATAALRSAPATVTISVTPTFAAKWLIPNLPDLTRRHPDVDLRVLATESLLSFHADGIDLAIRQGRPPFGASLEAWRMFTNRIIAVAAPALAAGETLPLPPEAFTRLALLHDIHNLWPDFCREVLGITDRTVRRGLRFSQTALGIDAALAGQGIALASDFLVAGDLAAGRLVQVVPGSLRGAGAFHLLALKGARRSESVNDVMDWLALQSEA